MPPPSGHDLRGGGEDWDRVDDDVALEMVHALYESIQAVYASAWRALKRALSIRPPSRRALRRLSARASLDAVKSLANSIDPNMINPAAWVLGPVQNLLGSVLQQIFAMRRLVLWEDTAATALLYLLLSAATLLLACTPWAIVIPFIFKWMGRLLGIVLLGPHMYWVGLRLDAIAEQQAHTARLAQVPSQQSPSAYPAAASSFPRAPGAEAETHAPSHRDRSQLGPHDSDGSDEEEDAARHAFEMDASHKYPRQPCRPDARSAFAFGAAP